MARGTQQYLNFFGGRHGLPTFHYAYGIRVDAGHLDRALESMVDRADRIFMNTDLTQAEYDAWNQMLNAWFDDMCARVRDVA